MKNENFVFITVGFIKSTLKSTMISLCSTMDDCIKGVLLALPIFVITRFLFFFLASASDDASLNRTSRARTQYEPFAGLMEPLIELGYSRSDVMQALTLNNANVELAGEWLVEHAKLQQVPEVPLK